MPDWKPKYVPQVKTCDKSSKYDEHSFDVYYCEWQEIGHSHRPVKKKGWLCFNCKAIESATIVETPPNRQIRRAREVDYFD